MNGPTRNLNDGLKSETKNLAKDTASGLIEVAKHHKAEFIKGMFTSIGEIPGGLKETGISIGEGAAVSLNKDLSGKLNQIYGEDVGYVQNSLFGSKVALTITSISGVGKVGEKVISSGIKTVEKGTISSEKVATSVSDVMLADADFSSRIPVRVDLEKHLVHAKVSGRTINGGHNMDNFNQTLHDAKGVIVSKTEIAPGIHEIHYQLPKGLDRKPEIKTVYDPNIHSDSKMIDMAHDAAAKGMIQYQVNGELEQKIQIQGIKFLVAVHEDKKQIQTVYPTK